MLFRGRFPDPACIKFVFFFCWIANIQSPHKWCFRLDISNFNTSGFRVKWKVSTHIRQGSILSFFAAPYFLFLAIYQVKRLFNKLWPLLRLRAELDLRSTNCFFLLQAVKSFCFVVHVLKILVLSFLFSSSVKNYSSHVL